MLTCTQLHLRALFQALNPRRLVAEEVLRKEIVANTKYPELSPFCRFW